MPRSVVDAAPRPDAIRRVEKALGDIRAGRMVILVDDEDRENEGDLCMSAELVTAEDINFMARHARGLICLSLDEERIDALELPMMVDKNKSSRTTAFTVSIEARRGVTTGISAADRAHTIRTAVAKDVQPGDLVSPGHVFPLKARRGGVLQRAGHTEGSVDLARLAGFGGSGVICEIMNEDGTMARLPDLEQFATRHRLRLLSIADLIEYRLAHERMIALTRRASIQLPTGREWDAHVYEVQGDERQFLALTHGPIDSSPTLVRVHTGSVLGDVFGVVSEKRIQGMDAVRAIETEGRGVVLFLPSNRDLADDIGFYLGEETTAEPAQAVVLREYGLGAQVLADLGLGQIRILTNRPRRLPSLEAYGLRVVEQILAKDFVSQSTTEPRVTH